MIYEDSDIDKDGAHGSVLFVGAVILVVVVTVGYALLKLIQGL